MTRLTRHIIVLLQILALSAYPQTVGAAASSGPGHGNPLAVHAADEAESQAGHHHDHASAEHTHGSKADGLASGTDEGGLACHPCCIGGKGSCVAVVTVSPDVVKPSFSAVFNFSRLTSAYSVQVAPLPHPPKART